jgi:putative transposase
VIVGRSKKGEAISEERRTRAALRKLWALRDEAKSEGDLATWRRAKAMIGYIKGKSVISLAETLDVTRGAINRWLQWYEAEGIEGLRTLPLPGRAPKLGAAHQQELITLIEAGPQQAGYSTGIWTGPMIGDLIHRHFGVRYHNHHVPWVLHRLGFSVQRPRKRLARADKEKQELWLRETFPAIKKKPRAAEA